MSLLAAITQHAVLSTPRLPVAGLVAMGFVRTAMRTLSTQTSTQGTRTQQVITAPANNRKSLQALAMERQAAEKEENMRRGLIGLPPISHQRPPAVAHASEKLATYAGSASERPVSPIISRGWSILAPRLRRPTP